MPVCPYHATSQGNDERCNITVADAGHISTVGTFATESGYDYLTIEGQRYTDGAGPSEVLLQAGATITWYSDHSTVAAGWTICWAAVTTPSPVESTTVSPTATVAPTSAPTRVPSAPPTVDSSLTITSGREYCHQVTVNGNPNCVTDGEGDYVRHPLLRHPRPPRSCSPRPRHRMQTVRTPPRNVGAASLRSRFAALPALFADRRWCAWVLTLSVCPNQIIP